MVMQNKMKVAGILAATAMLASALAPAQASGELPIFKACLAQAATAKDPKAARDQCVWEHWEMMAESD